ncbi:MAG: hypothetical protein R3B90_02325 [Planctomycetaceae bacterium]
MELSPNPEADSPPLPGLFVASAYYYLTLLVVLAGVVFGADFLHRQYHPNQNQRGFINSLNNWDGFWYARIVDRGYSFDPDRQSSVAFYPAYPSVARGVKAATGLSTEVSLLLTAHAALWGIFVTIGAYDRGRVGVRGSVDPHALMLTFGLWPMTLFFRMAYTESLFVLLEMVVLIGIHRRWRLPLIAVIAGAATAVRPVGVALLLPLLWDWNRRSTSWWGLFARMSVYGVVSCWGLLAYMGWLQVTFGDGLAFMQTQRHWATRLELAWPERAWSLLIFEPLWSVYLPSSSAYWANQEPVDNPLFSLQFWNPLLFLVSVVLVAWGAFKRWLTTPELLLACGLLAIPYVTHSYRALCLAQGRYAASVFPMYIVMARIATTLPANVRHSILPVRRRLGIGSALFAAWYRII